VDIKGVCQCCVVLVFSCVVFVYLDVVMETYQDNCNSSPYYKVYEDESQNDDER
jgi:hypothetical protein